MPKGIIRLCYKKTIDADSKDSWERNVFEDTHKEFFMQAQQFDPKGLHHTYREMLKAVPGSEPIQYLVSTAAANYIRNMQGSFYGFQDTLKMTTLPIRDFKFELVDSHITDKSRHKINLYFYSDLMIWIDSFSESILTADIRHLPDFIKGETVGSCMIPMGENISISFYQNFPGLGSNLN